MAIPLGSKAEDCTRSSATWRPIPSVPEAQVNPSVSPLARCPGPDRMNAYMSTLSVDVEELPLGGSACQQPLGSSLLARPVARWAAGIMHKTLNLTGSLAHGNDLQEHWFELRRKGK